jgi:hypothetical protein
MRQTLSKASTIYREEGLGVLLERARLRSVQVLGRVGYSPESIWDREWDLLVVLDACRLDLMESLDDEFGFLDAPGTFTSPGSTTIQWLEASFDPKYAAQLSETAYVTGNPNSVRAFPYEYPDRCSCGAPLDPSYEAVYHDGHTVCPSCGTEVDGDRQVPVQVLEEVWREAWDNDIGTIRPRPLTDAAIRTARRDRPGRMVVHYMQPHHPFVSAPELDQGSYIAEGDEYREKQSRTIWEKLSDGEFDRETIWTEYRNNLRLVLEDVALLLANVDAETAVVTSDHGNAIGEFGIYGHPGETPLSCLVDVPWYETVARDEGTHTPEEATDEAAAVTSDGVKDRLRDLGYFE